MPNLVELIQQIAQNSSDASAPANVLFGTVTSTSPLTVLVEQKLELTSEFLVLTKNVVDYTVDVTLNSWNTDSVSLDADHSHSASTSSSLSVSSELSPNEDGDEITNTISGSVDVTIEQTNIDLSHKHSISGTKSITVHNALVTGDKVTLIQQSGGQKFVVLDKVY